MDTAICRVREVESAMGSIYSCFASGAPLFSFSVKVVADSSEVLIARLHGIDMFSIGERREQVPHWRYLGRNSMIGIGKRACGNSRGNPG